MISYDITQIFQVCFVGFSCLTCCDWYDNVYGFGKTVKEVMDIIEFVSLSKYIGVFIDISGSFGFDENL